MSDSQCPAMQGRPIGCKLCIFRAGGPSDLCIKLADAYRRQADKRARADKPDRRQK